MYAQVKQQFGFEANKIQYFQVFAVNEVDFSLW